ncbi:glycosyltransferase [Candidatus Micrarchaeota archaeon]|nr:glycosyltransferase [Candidatus Micrarchaeota archaeon]
MLMKKNPLVSVIVPARNEQGVVGDSVKSILEQTYKRLEIIVINDGSTDRTREIVEGLRMRDKRIRLINFGKGHSAAFARNAGIRVMRGDIMVLHDADSIAGPRFVESIVRRFVEDGVDGVANKVLSRRPKTFIGKCVAAQRQMMWEYAQNEPVPLLDCTKVLVGHYSARAMKALKGFDERIFYFEDTDLSQRFYAGGFKATFEPRAVEYHSDPDSWGETTRQAKWFGKGMALRLRHYGEWRSFLIPLFSLALLAFLALSLLLPVREFQLPFLALFLAWLARGIKMSVQTKDPLHSFGFMLLFLYRNAVKLSSAAWHLLKES